MNETYTSKQAMAKLNLASRSAFYHMKRKFPHAFVVVSTESGNITLYDKPALDKFVSILNSLNKSG
jgi:hypothetical protein